MSKARNLAGFAGSISSNNDLNVGIITATSFSGTNVNVSGVVTATSFVGDVVIGAGSTSAPSLAPTGDSNTGVFFPSADTIALSSGGSERLRVDSSGNINIDSGGVYYDAANNRLAVGSTAPARQFTVYNSSTPIIQLVNSTTGQTANDGVMLYESGSNFVIENQEAGEIQIYNSGSQRAVIDSSGRLLLGTSTSTSVVGQAQLQLFGEGLAANVSLTRSGATTQSANLTFGRTRGDASTRVSLNNDDVVGRIYFAGDDGTDIETLAASIQCLIDGTPGANDMPGRLVFSTTADGASSPTERMRIDNTGLAFLMSTTSVLSTSTTAAAGTGLEFIEAKHSGNGAPASGTVSFRVFTNGNVQNTNNSYTAISDIKLKENIADASSQWDDLKALRVRNYNLKEGQTHRQIGLIAQEVESISPGLVYESPDRDEEGNDLGTVTKSVNYSVLYMKAVKALQEAMERIETLESSNADLLARVTALETP